MTDRTVWLTLAVCGYGAMLYIADGLLRVRSSRFDVLVTLPTIFAAGILDVMVAGGDAWWRQDFFASVTFLGLVGLTLYGYRRSSPFAYAAAAASAQALGLLAAAHVGMRIDADTTSRLGELAVQVAVLAGLLAVCAAIWAAVGVVNTGERRS